MQMRVQSLGWEDLEEEMATHSNILAWKIPWTEEPGWLQPTGSQRGRARTHAHGTHTHTKNSVYQHTQETTDNYLSKHKHPIQQRGQELKEGSLQAIQIVLEFEALEEAIFRFKLSTSIHFLFPFVHNILITVVYLHLSLL